nr:hypothetical protein [Desulfobacula sp.]
MIMNTKKNSGKDIKVIGIGGRGLNTINNLIDLNLQGVRFVSINTDFQSLKNSKAYINLLIGEKITKGESAKGNPLIGRGSAFESAKAIKEIVTNSQYAFIITGLGGGTGTGAAPVIAEFCKNSGAKVIAIVSTPFSFEGKKRKTHAYQGIYALDNTVDAILIRANDRIREGIDKNETILNMFKKADEFILQIIYQYAIAQVSSIIQ